MAGEVQAVSEGIALAKEMMPMIKEFFGMFGLGAAASGTSVVPTASVPEVASILMRIATALEGIEAKIK